MLDRRTQESKKGSLSRWQWSQGAGKREMTRYESEGGIVGKQGSQSKEEKNVEVET